MNLGATRRLLLITNIRRLATITTGSGITTSGAKSKPSTTDGIVASNTTQSQSSSSLPSIETYRPKQLITPAFVTSDVPEYMMTKRQARIFRPTKNAMQSGTNETAKWQIDFDPEEKWTNPLMGWASSSDAVQALRLRFPTKEDAIRFAEKQGWDYIVQKEQLAAFRKKSYGDNFKYSPGKLRYVRTK